MNTYYLTLTLFLLSAPLLPAAGMKTRATTKKLLEERIEALRKAIVRKREDAGHEIHTLYRLLPEIKKQKPDAVDWHFVQSLDHTLSFFSCCSKDYKQFKKVVNTLDALLDEDE